LALLPFEAIKLADGKYLVESVPIRYVATGRDLMPLPTPKEGSPAALILSDPDYDFAGPPGSTKLPQPSKGKPLQSGLRFQSLPGFAREAQAVAKILAGLPTWKLVAASRGQASEETLAQAVRPRLLYLITHGFFLHDVERPRDPLGLRDLELVSG